MDLNEFERESDLDTEILLADLSFDFLNESIISQINDPLSSNENYIMTIIDKCELLKKKYMDNLEYIRIINEEKTKFFNTIIEKIDSKFMLGLDLSYFDSYDEIQELGEILYNYFILEYLQNISTFVFQYILANREFFYKEFSQKSKKDVSTLAKKKTLKDKQKLAVCANISSTVKMTLDMEIPNSEFIELSREDGDYESVYLINLIDANVLTGDFVRNYIDVYINNQYHSIMDNIITDVKYKLSIEYGLIKNA